MSGCCMGYSAAYCIARGECNRGLSVPAPASATPADVGELVERLRAPHSVDTWHAAQTAATALEQVTRERDEWERRAGDAIMGEAAAIERAESAEAKLAEARKVIEPFARAADNAERLAGHDGPLGQCVELEHLRAARRFLEETK